MGLNESLSMITALGAAGAKKINFAGGEPFLRMYQPHLGAMVRGAKEAGFASVSVISNASAAETFDKWMSEYGRYLDVLGISCDTIIASTNVAHGRVARSSAVNHNSVEFARPALSGRDSPHIRRARLAAEVAAKHGIKLKINTVVTKVNKDEDMSSLINDLRPTKWKIFQVLPLRGENCGGKDTMPPTTQNVSPFLITREEFEAYVERNKAGLVDENVAEPEDNSTMLASYVLIDEFGRFLDSSTGGKVPTRSILDVGVEEAARDLLSSPGGGYDHSAFERRRGDSWVKMPTTTTY